MKEVSVSDARFSLVAGVRALYREYAHQYCTCYSWTSRGGQQGRHWIDEQTYRGKKCGVIR